MDMIELRELLAAAIESAGHKITGSGSSMVSPETDLDVVVEGRRFCVTVRDLDAAQITPAPILHGVGDDDTPPTTFN